MNSSIVNLLVQLAALQTFAGWTLKEVIGTEREYPNSITSLRDPTYLVQNFRNACNDDNGGSKCTKQTTVPVQTITGSKPIIDWQCK